MPKKNFKAETIKDFGIIEKNDVSAIGVKIMKYNAPDQYLDIRTYWKLKGEEGLKPSGKGCSIKLAKLPDLMKMLKEVEKFAQENS